MNADRRRTTVRQGRDEDPLESPFDDDDVIERCWGYEIPVRHRASLRREETR